jgi:phage regulator Rha-like protein
MPKTPTPAGQLLVPVELVERRIYLIRGQKVMLDSDLAELYQVLTKNLNLAVRRNANRFPPDFMFQLTREEAESLRLQIATSNEGRGGRRYPPYAFTEHGVAMLSSVLNSERAVQMNIVIIRAFLKLREVLATHKDLAERMEQIESSQREHGSIIVHLAGVYKL